MNQQTDFIEKHEEIRELSVKIPKGQIAPSALERNKKRTFPWDDIHLFGEAGLLGVGICEGHRAIRGGRIIFALWQRKSVGPALQLEGSRCGCRPHGHKKAQINLERR